MGVFDIRTELKDEKVIVAEQKKQKLLSTEIIHSGHHIFEYNTITNKIVMITSTGQKHQIMPNGQIIKRTAYEAKNNCIYIAALNRKNAILKLFKNHNIIYKDDLRTSKE